jgi:tetratricopeptide (TPR) repeat protein
VRVRGEVDSRRLAELVARIDRLDDRPAGTGFFVAPGWVLTCAHVVNELDEVLVVPHAGGGPLPARVRARSAAPEPGRLLPPFPDLALVELVEPFEHRCVLLEDVDPGQDQDCVAWGYSGWEEGVVPQGSAARLQFQGRDGDGFLGFKDDVVRRGLSGSPLVCPQRRAVVGVVTATRDQTKNVGGWACPVGALKGGRGVPEELATLGQQVLAANQAAVLADRGAWHAVVPIEGADGLLTRGWADYRKTRRADPADLLLAEFGVVPYLFRDHELAKAEGWCLSAPALDVAVVVGLGGSGKNRFAIELCQRMIGSHGWTAGELEKPADSSLRERLASLALPRLIFIDYAETQAPTATRELLESLQDSTPIAPARLLLLVRDRTHRGEAGGSVLDSVRQLASGQVKQLIDDRTDDPEVTGSLTLDQRLELFDEAVGRYAAVWCDGTREVAVGRADAPDLSGDDYGVALAVMFEALDAVLSADDDEGGGVSHDPFWGPGPAQRVLAHEERYWQVGAPDGESRELLRDTVALATLAGAADVEEADRLLACLGDLGGDLHAERRRQLSRWLTTLREGEAYLNPLRPDRLGEALVSATLLDEDRAELLSRVMQRVSDRQLVRVLTVVGRAVARDSDVADLAVHTLAGLHRQLVERAKTMASSSSTIVGDAQLATALTRLVDSPTGVRLDRADGDPGYRRDVSMSLNKLGDLERVVGDRAEARRLYQRSLELREGLAGSEPDNTGYQRDVSMSLNKLGDLERVVGDRAEARRWYERSLQIREWLAEREPANTGYQRDVSLSMNKLGDLERVVGDRAEARRWYERSLQIREWLAGSDPDNAGYQRDVSASLEQLGVMARDAGDDSSAVTLLRSAVARRSQLKDREPDRVGFAEGLAVSLRLLASVSDTAANEQIRRRIDELLAPFEALDRLSGKGRSALNWARGDKEA